MENLFKRCFVLRIIMKRSYYQFTCKKSHFISALFQSMVEFTMWKTGLYKWPWNPVVERPASIKKIPGSIHALVNVYIKLSLLWALARSLEVVDEHSSIFELQKLQFRVVKSIIFLYPMLLCIYQNVLIYILFSILISHVTNYIGGAYSSRALSLIFLKIIFMMDERKDWQTNDWTNGQTNKTATICFIFAGHK